MRATLMYGTNDVRIEHVSVIRNAATCLSQPTDAPAGAVRLGRAGVCIPYDGYAL